MMHDSLNISEHTHHVLLNKSLTISDTKQHTHTQLFILDSWCTSSMYLHPQRKRNPTRSLQPATLLALRIAVVHCLPPAASFRHPAKERNSAGIQWQFGHNCRNQIKLYIAIWKLNMLEVLPKSPNETWNQPCHTFRTPENPYLRKHIPCLSLLHRIVGTLHPCSSIEVAPYTAPAASLRHGWLWGLLLWGLLLFIVFLLQRLYLPAATVPGTLPTFDGGCTCT